MKKGLSWSFSSVLVGSLLVASALAASPPGDEIGALRQQAIGLLQQGSWEAAIAAYERVVAQDPADAQSWAYLAMANRNLERFDAAVEAYGKALEIDGKNATALLGMAVVLERRGEVAEALELMAKAASNGAPPWQLEGSPALAPLRAHDGFARVLEIAERATNPCRFEEPYDDFDFLVGDWDVLIGGHKQAENLFTKEMSDCLIRERFHVLQGGFRGESLNFFDPETGKWKQSWVDSSGGVTRYQGGLVEPGVIRMEGARSLPGGDVYLARVTWTEVGDGTVRHRIERSSDEGATWTPTFDATYVRSDRGSPKSAE